MKSQGYSIFPQLCQFLLSFHLWIFWNHSPTHVSYPQGCPLAFLRWCHSAFEALKKAFTTALVLTHWILNTQITVETDASDYTLATVLSIMTPDGNFHPIAFHSQTFSALGTQLQCPWQRATRNFWSFQMMVTLPRRLWTSDRCGHQSPEFAIPFNDKNPHVSTSMLVWISFQIQPGNLFLSWKTWNQTQHTH